MIICRKLTLEDSPLLFNWRNDPRVYKYLNTPHPVKKALHIEWLRQTLKNRERLFYVGMYANSPCGVIRYDRESDEKRVEVGLYLAPEFQGKGLSSSLLLAGEKELIRAWANVRWIVAKVHPENTASINMFKANGYCLNGDVYEKELVNK